MKYGLLSGGSQIYLAVQKTLSFILNHKPQNVSGFAVPLY
jgi:hypothetical protein